MQIEGKANLSGYAVYAAMLSAAGLPIYIHAPKFYVDEYGVPLAALGTVLFVLRFLDVVQDPFFGRLSERFKRHRQVTVALAGGVMTVGMFGLFAIQPMLPPLIWFAIMLALVFSSFSFLTINFYAQGVSKAETIGTFGHIRLARWRESGALLGVCAAAISPFVLAQIMERPFTGFAISFAILTLIGMRLMKGEWSTVSVQPSTGFGVVIQDPLARRLLILAFVNAAPVAVSSTLFLFYVESRLMMPGTEGPLLLLFFLSAAISVPFWGRIAENWGSKNTLLFSMLLAILSFGFAALLGAGDWLAFAIISFVSGAALGADLTLLPAMFAKRLAQITPSAVEGFGLWSFVSKFSLAFAAILLLPILESVGFQSGASNNTPEALFVLSFLYAIVPCFLKGLAMLLLAVTDLKEA